MHLTYRRSGWRFQIRVPRDVERTFGRTPIRLNLGPMGKRDANLVSPDKTSLLQVANLLKTIAGTEGITPGGSRRADDV